MEKKSHKKFTILLIFIAVLLGVWLLAKRLLFAKEEVTYITADVIRMDIVESVLASGTLKAFKTVEVGAQVSGQLKKLHADVGDHVSKGQLLAEIDPVLQQNALREAQAHVESLQAQKRAKQALLKQYDAAYRRQKEMIARDASSVSDMETAQAQLDSTRAEIASLDAQINSAEIAVDTAKANLGYTQISAPMDGVVISVNIEEGQTVINTQTATTILTLANLNTITVRAKISEADIMRVKPGLNAYFMLLGDSDTRYYGKLRAIEPGPSTLSSNTASSVSSTTDSSSAIYYNGLFEVPNPDNKLRVSMTAQVSIILNEAKHALCIPLSALGDKQKDGDYSVRILKNNIPETRTIRIGISNNVHVQVTEGLQERDKVVIGDSMSKEKNDSEHHGPPPRG